MSKKQIKRVLVANRGEIAIRIFRALAEMDITSVCIYSKEDKYSLFRQKADESYQIGEGLSPLGAYLDIPGIVKLAKEKNVDAIHPGYGFLSENAKFAKACEDAGIIFIGPSSVAIDSMGDKINAKKIAKGAGVPSIPGSEKPLASAEEAKKLAEEIGYPVMLKASAGGGGRGIRIIHKPEEIENSLAMVQSEASKAFGNADVFMEKFLEEPRHIEVQVLADTHGNTFHLFERDCSVQRRYQKIVECAPALNLTDKCRNALHADAIKLAKAVGYVSAGTVEFLVDKHQNHYFMEMNTRVQVEHTITEMVTGIDIVRSQIAIAQGYSLNDPIIGINGQESIKINGYSIQSRVTTEDPANNFAPDTGKITAYRPGEGLGVRLDGNAFPGALITPYYDSLLLKVIATDQNFEKAIAKSIRALKETRIRGVKTNIPFILNILTNKTFTSGKCYTKLIDDEPSLFEFTPSKNRANKALSYIGNKTLERKAEKPLYAEPKVPKYCKSTIPDGVKQILDTKGPEALSKWLLGQKKLLITDTTMRDAQQSLIATRLRTKDMLNIAKPTAHILNDCFSLEMWGGATFDTSYRFLKESPWERLDALRKKIPNIPFQMLFRGANAVGYSSYPDSLITDFIKESAASGMDIFRVFDSLNWLPNMELAIEEVVKSGKVCNAAICYTGNIIDPKRDKYSLKYYTDFAKELERRGAHILTIKDMSGILRPYAAKKLISALKDAVSLPIHLHTHDTSGNGIAAYLQAAEAGVDIVDAAISSMSSLTSQPSMNSLVAALENCERDTGFNSAELQKLTDYWADVRTYYSQFEGDIKTPEAEIYQLEIPGGQYTNLKSQVASFGLADRFDEVKEKYVEVNQILGDIVKVTPSSKMVGDMAIFMTQNDLTSENIVERGKSLNFPDSVVSYFQGYMGQPSFGFPKDLQQVVLKGEKAFSNRPGENLAPINLSDVKRDLASHVDAPTDRDAISWALYPKVFEDYAKFLRANGDLSALDTSVFFGGLNIGEETELEIEPGKTLVIKLICISEPNDEGIRTLRFELNGALREIPIIDKSADSAASNVRYAEDGNKSHIGSSIPGAVSKVLAKKGDKVEVNQPLFVIEAMKMETSVVAMTAGVLDEVFVTIGQSVKAGELLGIVK